MRFGLAMAGARGIFNALMEPPAPASDLNGESAPASGCALRAAPRWFWALALLFVAATLGLSWWRWWTFQYRSFDLAFYVQSLWLALRGQGVASVLEVPLLGNHAEPIVYLLAPLFALVPHPMLLPALQVLALAGMPWTAWRICGRLGFARAEAAAYSSLTLLAPAAGYVGVHEFHPEAFAAPVLLLLFEARLAGRLVRHWAWFLAALFCKENIALVLVVWLLVQAWLDRRRGAAWQRCWNLLPLAVAVLWLGLYALVLAPRLNGGQVDYLQLYGHLGSSPGGIVANLFTDPMRFVHALFRAAVSGNLLWAMLVCFAGLPLLRPRWLLIAAPVLLQHLLSVRPAEWNIYFHYPAPVLALFWMAGAEALGGLPWIPWRRWLVGAAALGCVVLQGWIGPYRAIGGEWARREGTLWERALRQRMLEPLQRDPSLAVAAGLPYLSHLATRQKLHSLHFVLKGVKTLSTARYTPGYEPDAVLVDCSDDATFSHTSAFYHPSAPSMGGAPLPSSEVLLNVFLSRGRWQARSCNALVLLEKGVPFAPGDAEGAGEELFPGTRLLSIRPVPGTAGATFGLELEWEFAGPREHIPWLTLHVGNAGASALLALGLCAPEAPAGRFREVRMVQVPPSLGPGQYLVSYAFSDRLKTLWSRTGAPAVISGGRIGTIRIGPEPAAAATVPGAD